MAKIDKKIIELFKIITTQKQELDVAEKASKKPWKTHCSFPVIGRGPVNIQTANKETLIELMSVALMQIHYRNEACDLLGIESDKVTVEMDDWIADFKKRLTIISLRETKEKLNSLDARLGQIISPEQRREMELQEITGELGLDDLLNSKQ